MLSFLLYISVLLASTSAICYYPDGSAAPQDTPCSNAGGNSTCCGQGYVCLSNNICMSIASTHDPGSSTTYARGSCTDQSWLSGSCPLFCVNGHYDNLAGGEGIAKCQNVTIDSYCCLNDNQKNCNCDSGLGTIHFEGSPIPLTTIGVTATSSSSSTSSIPSSVTYSDSLTSLPPSISTGVSTTITSSFPSPSSPSASPSPLPTNNNVAIGAGVGVPLGIIALAAIAYFVYRYSARRGKTRPHPLVGPGIDMNVQTTKGQYSDATNPYLAELPTHAQQHAQGRPSELPSH